jgi:hypothetical protein
MKIVTFQDVLPNLRKGNKVSRFRRNLLQKMNAKKINPLGQYCPVKN